MKIILVGETNQGSRTPQRLRALRELGHDVVMIPTTPTGWNYETRPSLWYRLAYRLRLPPDLAGANKALAEQARGGVDVVILDNARSIRAATLAAVRRHAPGARLIWYSEDDSMNPIHRTRWLEGCMPWFDLWVTTKSFNAQPGEVPALGVRRVLFVHNSFCPHDHAPLTLTQEERQRFAAPISFIGTYEEPRANDLLALAQAGLTVRVWGNGWQSMSGTDPNLIIEGRAIYGDDYRRAVAASGINLCFLRRGNRDLQTCRSLELPAMGVFMMHESSAEMEKLFTPDGEAVYFSRMEELIDKARHWLADEAGRQRVAAAARRRAVEGGHSHHDRWRDILAQAMDSSCVS